MIKNLCSPISIKSELLTWICILTGTFALGISVVNFSMRLLLLLIN